MGLRLKMASILMGNKKENFTGLSESSKFPFFYQISQATEDKEWSYVPFPQLEKENLKIISIKEKYC